jgi:1-acyl-sn-glycerol-3-phosphate acyltransferase
LADQSATNPNIIHYPRRRPIRWLLRNGIHLILSLIADIQINGCENLPKTGPLIIVANHFHFLDPVAVIHLTSYPLEFIGGTRTPNAPGWTEFFRKGWGVLPIIRGGSSRDGLLRAQSILEQKGVMAIFPEGGSWAAVLRPPRPGAVLLAARTNAVIVPVGLDGFTEVFASLGKGRRGRVTINIGKPFGPFELDTRSRSARQAMDDLGHEIMRHIAELIPSERRGFYSDDPAIREAAKGSEVYPWEGLVET